MFQDVLDWQIELGNAPNWQTHVFLTVVDAPQLSGQKTRCNFSVSTEFSQVQCQRNSKALPLRRHAGTTRRRQLLHGIGRAWLNSFQKYRKISYRNISQILKCPKVAMPVVCTIDGYMLHCCIHCRECGWISCEHVSVCPLNGQSTKTQCQLQLSILPGCTGSSQQFRPELSHSRPKSQGRHAQSTKLEHAAVDFVILVLDFNLFYMVYTPQLWHNWILTLVAIECGKFSEVPAARLRTWCSLGLFRKALASWGSLTSRTTSHRLLMVAVCGHNWKWWSGCYSQGSRGLLAKGEETLRARQGVKCVKSCQAVSRNE